MECKELSPKVVGDSPSEQTKPRSGKEHKPKSKKTYCIGNMNCDGRIPFLFL